MSAASVSTVHYQSAHAPIALPVFDGLQNEIIPSKAPPSFDPLDINARKWLPPIGVANALIWGVSNVIEHQAQQGHLTQGPARKFLAPLALAAPVINVTYGLSNALGAAANGYAWRAMAFGLYGLFSGATAPWIMRDTQLALKLAEAQHGGQTHLIEALKQAGQKLRPLTTLVNYTVPIGIQLGLLSVTGSAQSKSDLTLIETQGKSFSDMLSSPRNPLGNVLKDNWLKEAKNWLHLMEQTPQQLVELLANTGKGIKQLFQPDAKTSDNKASAWNRLTSPLIGGDSVSFLYALTATGRMGAAALALGIGLTHINSLVQHSPFGLVETEAANWVKPTKNILDKKLLIGQFAGSLSALLTQFNHWPIGLSMAYRLSALPFLLSGIVSATKKPILGFDAAALAKMGAFIQGSSYFTNLWLAGEKPVKSKDASVGDALHGTKN